MPEGTGVYSGDDVNAIVGDVGTLNSRFGYSGEDAPQAVFSSVVGHLSGKGGDEASMEVDDRWVVGDAPLRVCTSDVELTSPLVDGRLKNWDALEQVWSHAFKDCLRADMKGQPFLFTVPSWSTEEELAKATELAFEKFEMGAVYLARNAVLSAFAAGLATALVCDCGAGSTSAVPVVDGFALSTKGCVRSSRGGNWLDDAMAKQLAQKKVHITLWGEKSGAKGKAGGSAPTPAPTGLVSYGPALRKFHEMKVVRDIKEVMCTITQRPSEDSESSDAESDEEGAEPYVLPDGTRVTQDPSIASVADAVFASSLDPSKGSKHADELSLSQMVYKSLEQSDVDVRRELLANIVLTGAGSLYRGLPERLQDDLTTMVPGAYKVKAIVPVPIERRFGVWIGGSILASCGNFHQLWLSKKEYDEMGALRAVRDRFH